VPLQPEADRGLAVHRVAISSVLITADAIDAALDLRTFGRSISWMPPMPVRGCAASVRVLRGHVDAGAFIIRLGRRY